MHLCEKIHTFALFLVVRPSAFRREPFGTCCTGCLASVGLIGCDRARLTRRFHITVIGAKEAWGTVHCNDNEQTCINIDIDIEKH